MSIAAPNKPRPTWAVWLGAIAVIFGVLQTAVYSNEWMTQKVISEDITAMQSTPDCPEDELLEEDISLAECELMAAKVNIMIVSRPSWFRDFQMCISLLGGIIAFASIFVGAALVEYRNWAPTGAVVTFTVLLVINTVEFAAATHAGPLLRATYLWNITLWFFIHLIMTSAALAGHHKKDK
ncbi:MAG: hypothetical protein P8J18_08235 [Halieaceae bacterium]|nr:hypothetical protein [Halieaceae bacterium]